MDWPPYLPDMNPIEHAWARLKATLYRLDPDIEKYAGPKEELKARFAALIEQAWELLGQDYFDGLIRSMDNRINALLEADGWYTRY